MLCNCERTSSSQINKVLRHSHSQIEESPTKSTMSDMSAPLLQQIWYNLGKISFNGASPCHFCSQKSVLLPSHVFLWTQSSNQPRLPIWESVELCMSRHHWEEFTHSPDERSGQCSVPYLNCSRGYQIELWSVKNLYFHLDNKLILNSWRFLILRPPLSFGKQTLSHWSQLIFWDPVPQKGSLNARESPYNFLGALYKEK